MRCRFQPDPFPVGAAALQEAVGILEMLTPEAQQTFWVKQVRQMIDEELAKLPAKTEG